MSSLSDSDRDRIRRLAQSASQLDMDKARGLIEGTSDFGDKISDYALSKTGSPMAAALAGTAGDFAPAMVGAGAGLIGKGHPVVGPEAEIKGVNNPPGAKIADATQAFQERGLMPPSTDTKIAQAYGQTGEVRDALPELIKRAEIEHKSSDTMTPADYNEYTQKEYNYGYQPSAYDNPRNKPPLFEPNLKPGDQGIDLSKPREPMAAPKNYIEPGMLEGVPQNVLLPSNTMDSLPWRSAENANQTYWGKGGHSWMEEGQELQPNIGGATEYNGPPQLTTVDERKPDSTSAALPAHAAQQKDEDLPAPTADELKSVGAESLPPPTDEELRSVGAKKSAMQAAQLTPANKAVVEGDPDQALKWGKLVTNNPTGQAAIATAIQMAPLAMGFLGGHPEQPNMKPNAPEISAAAERLGTKATPGMLSDNEVARRLENSLSQSPTIGGALTKGPGENVRKAMDASTKSLLSEASPLEPDEVGAKAKQLLSDETDRRFQESRRLFDELRQNTENIGIHDDAGVQQVARNILSIPEIQNFPSSKAASVAKDVSGAISERGWLSPNDIKQIKTSVGQKAAAAEDRSDQVGLWTIYDKLSRLEMNTIKRGIMTSARTAGEGNTIAQGMLGQLKSARAGYKSGMDAIGDVAQATNLPEPRNPENFVDSINKIQNEKIANKLLPLDNAEASRKLFSFSPEAASELRKARIGDIAKRSSNINAEPTTTGLLNATKNLNPKTEKLLFGKGGQQSLEDMRTLNQSKPEVTGPSGTPQGMEYIKSLINPIAQARDLGRFALYKMMTTQPGMKKIMMQRNALPNAAQAAGLLPKDKN